MILINFFFISFALGDISVQNRHSVDNVSERDFLRTEGDPGASGYTIKEAVALTQSVVSLCSDCMILEWYSVWFSCIINFADVWAKQCKIFMLSWYIINYSQKWFPNEILIITTDIFFCLFSSSILVYVWPFQIPGQRALALHLIFSVLDKALHNINQKPVGSTLGDVNKLDRSTDWEAIWAFALGPEPELVLSLRWIPSECLYCWFPLFYQCMLLYYAFGKLTFIIISSRGIILSLDFH